MTAGDFGRRTRKTYNSPIRNGSRTRPLSFCFSRMCRRFHQAAPITGHQQTNRLGAEPRWENSYLSRFPWSPSFRSMQTIVLVVAKGQYSFNSWKHENRALMETNSLTLCFCPSLHQITSRQESKRTFVLFHGRSDDSPSCSFGALDARNFAGGLWLRCLRSNSSGGTSSAITTTSHAGTRSFPVGANVPAGVAESRDGVRGGNPVGFGRGVRDRAPQPLEAHVGRQYRKALAEKLVHLAFREQARTTGGGEGKRRSCDMCVPFVASGVDSDTSFCSGQSALTLPEMLLPPNGMDSTVLSNEEQETRSYKHPTCLQMNSSWEPHPAHQGTTPDHLPRTPYAAASPSLEDVTGTSISCSDMDDWAKPGRPSCRFSHAVTCILEAKAYCSPTKASQALRDTERQKIETGRPRGA